MSSFRKAAAVKTGLITNTQNHELDPPKNHTGLKINALIVLWKTSVELTI